MVDRYGSRRAWIAGSLALLALGTLLLPLLPPGGRGSAFWLLCIALVALSATQDVAIDAAVVETTTREELGVANSVRIAAYRVAMLAAGGVLLWVAGRAGWTPAFITAGAVLALLAVIAATSPTLRAIRPEAATGGSLAAPIRALLSRRGIWAVLIFALTFKLDIAALEPMTRPFWLDRGFTLEEIGTVLSTGRLVATVAGAALGGWLTTRWGIGAALWRLGLVQALSSLGYAAAAFAAPSKRLMLAAAFFENFAAGLGTAAFVAYLMSVCERRYAATQYALLSALLNLTRSVAGPIAGGLAERMGYGPFFALTFALGLPAFLLIPLLERAGPPDA